MVNKLVAAASTAAVVVTTVGCSILNRVKPWGEFYTSALEVLARKAGHSDVLSVHLTVPNTAQEKDAKFAGEISPRSTRPGRGPPADPSRGPRTSGRPSAARPARRSPWRSPGSTFPVPVMAERIGALYRQAQVMADGCSEKSAVLDAEALPGGHVQLQVRCGSVGSGTGETRSFINDDGAPKPSRENLPGTLARFKEAYAKYDILQQHAADLALPVGPEIEAERGDARQACAGRVVWNPDEPAGRRREVRPALVLQERHRDCALHRRPVPATQLS